MHKASLGVLGLAAAGAFAFSLITGSVSNVSAESAPKPPACKTLKDEDACKAREDCTWVKASVDAKTGKEKRKAYCRSKPKAKKK
jgi:hypothetical protein